MSASHETSERLRAYGALLRKWNRRINLVAPGTIDDLEDRHIADCHQLADLAKVEAGTWVDLGSGGGLPGLVMAIATADSAACWVMVESDQRKAAFLRTVIRELDLSRASVLTGRIEALPPIGADGLTARALAPLPRLLPYLQRHLRPSGTAWLMKGRNWRQELEAARDGFSFTTEVYPSQTDPEAAILKLSDIHP